MSRDLFAQTLAPQHAPKRSRWTIVGSILAHVALLAVLLILPILSAFDTFVVRANESLQFTVPAIVVPASPPPPSTTPTIAPDINPLAAPPAPPEHPVTSEVTVPPPPSSLFAPGGPPGFGPGVGVPGGRGSGDFGLDAPPVPSPTPAGPVRPGGDIKSPSRVAYTAPTYPALAKTARVEGTVYLEATIDANGIVRDVRILRGIPLLDEAAREAVSQWRYTPTKLNGVAVPVILTVTVTFTLR